MHVQRPKIALTAYISKLTGIVLLSLLAAASLSAQTTTTSATDGTTPPGLAPGAPAGSYALSGFENVNLYNGSLNFKLPLLKVGGRGGAGASIILPVDQKWRVSDFRYQAAGIWQDIKVPQSSWWATDEAFRYGPGLLVGRMAGENPFSCFQGGNFIYLKTLTRLTFKASDGTEYELRDQLTGGQPSDNQCNSMSVPTRGTVFTTADGTSATFVANAPIADQVAVFNGPSYYYVSGYLFFKDGTRYQIDAGKVREIRDRNGNRTTFDYNVSNRLSTITDSINRQVTFAYDQAEGGQYGTCDRITFNGFAADPRYIRVCKTALSGAMRSTQPGDVTTPQTFQTLFPELNGSTASAFNPTVVSSVWLPNNQRYQLFYNQYGELARVVLPTGGAYEYDWRAGIVGSAASGVVTGMQIYRRVVERRVYSAGTTPENRTTYSRPESVSGNLGYVVMEQCKPTSNDVVGQCGTGTNLVGHSRHYFFGSPSQSIYLSPTGYPKWKEGREYQTEVYDTDGTTLLRWSENTWQQPLAGAGWPLTQAETSDLAKSNNPQVTQTVSKLSDTNQVSKQTFSYDQYFNQTDIYEYDFGLGGPGAIVRRVHSDYLTSTSYSDPPLGKHIRNLPTQQWVSTDAAGTNKLSLTTYAYDQTSLTDCPSIIQHDDAFTTEYLTRGNVTSMTRYENALTATGPLTSISNYDIAGNLVSTTDPKGKTSTVAYHDAFSDGVQRYTYAFPTSTISAVPDPEGRYGSTSPLTTATVYEFFTGRVKSSTDASNTTTVLEYNINDKLDRVRLVKRAVGTAVENHSTFNYDDTNRVITTASDLNYVDDGALISEQFYDQLGRTIETRQYEGGSNHIAVKTQYDVLGRAYKSSNPFRLWLSETPIWTTSTFDALGRLKTITTPDGAEVNTYYSGTQVLVKDQTGKERMSQTNVLGQLTDVWEITAADDATETISFPTRPEVTAGYRTKYAYDVLGNLTNVAQQKGTSGITQTRTFIYNSLSQLKDATNPESGHVAYDYDANGNLLHRTDARLITTTYAYDALNRNTSVTYTNDPAGTPTVHRFYDGWGVDTNNQPFNYGIAYSKGRMWRTETEGATGSRASLNSFDELGKPIGQSQQFKSGGVWSAAYNVGATYDKAGHILIQTYPSGHTVNYNYDGAGRLGDKDAQNLS